MLVQRSALISVRSIVLRTSNARKEADAELVDECCLRVEGQYML